ncbi:MAG: alkaline phosphatase family protein [Rhodoluna sp.]
MMLPSVPKSLGRLSEVFNSAMMSLTGTSNTLQLGKARSSCVILVDGLGSRNLLHRSGHAPKLVRQLEKDGSILVGFPTTTATSLTSFATGVQGGEHGIIGYEIFDRNLGRPVNLLTGLSDAQAENGYQPIPTASGNAKSKNLQVHFVGAPEFENSTFTKITMPEAQYHAGKSVEDRFAIARKLLTQGKGALVYLYISELDSKAHAFGADSVEWLEQLELLESQVGKLIAVLPKDAGVLLTADHGVIDVAREKQIYLDEFQFTKNLVNVAGDPRVNFLYFNQEPEPNLISNLRDWLHKRAYVVSRQQMIESGWYGPVSKAAAHRMPDVFIIARGETAIYHRDFAKPHSLKMIGQHGGIDNEELTVPLLRFGAFQK